MEDYKLPQATLPVRAFAKASSAVGIYFICPACHYETLYPDERLASGLRNCPCCHAALQVPEGKERELVIKRAMDAFIP